MLLASVALAACGGKKAPGGYPPVAVDVVPVRSTTLATYAHFNGQITPVLQATLSTSESGKVVRVDVNEGDFVTKGQELAALDTSTLEAQRAAAQASVLQDAARLKGSRVQAPVNSQQYSSAVATARQNVQAANNSVVRDRASLTNNEATYRGDAQLVKQGYLAVTAYQLARANFVAAQKTLQTDVQAVTAAQAALQTALSNTQQRAVDQATIDQNASAMVSGQAAVQQIDAQIGLSTIVAPFDGQITSRLVDPGSFAGSSQALLQLSQVSTVYVIANVPDVDLSTVPVGRSVTFQTPSVPNRTFRGNVFDVNTVPTSGTLSYRVRLREPNPGLVLRSGMLVVVTAVRERAAHVLAVPNDAVGTGTSGPIVYTIAGGKAKAVNVKTGVKTDAMTEVRGDGIAEGTQVVASIPSSLQPGAPVAVASASPAPAGGQ